MFGFFDIFVFCIVLVLGVGVFGYREERGR